MCFDADAPDFFQQTDRVARKQHKCCECRLPILPGDRYVESKGVWSGEFSVYRQCLFCVWLVERVIQSELDTGCGSHEAAPPFGWLYDSLSDGHDEGIGMLDLEDLLDRSDARAAKLAGGKAVSA